MEYKKILVLALVLGLSLACTKQLKLTVSGSREGNGRIDFTYSFNQDCTVTSWGWAGPVGSAGDDTLQAGAKIANTQYHSNGWAYTNGDPYPAGTYTVNVTGTYNGADFTLSASDSL